MANDDEVRLTPRAEEMRRLIAEQRASGMTVAAFAARRGVKATTLFHWRHRFRRELAASEHPTFVPVRIVEDEPEDRESASDPAERTATPIESPAFAIELRGQRKIAVPRDFSADDLRRLIEVVESC